MVKKIPESTSTHRHRACYSGTASAGEGGNRTSSNSGEHDYFRVWIVNGSSVFDVEGQTPMMMKKGFRSRKKIFGKLSHTFKFS